MCIKRGGGGGGGEGGGGGGGGGGVPITKSCLVSDKYRSEVALKIDIVKDRFLPFHIKKRYKEIFLYFIALKTKMCMLSNCPP